MELEYDFNFFREVRKKIEKNRCSKNFFWRIAVLTKDFFWRVYFGISNEFKKNALSHLAFVVGSKDLDNFYEVGNQIVKYFENEKFIQKGDSVLDVGCGCGRIAIPLCKKFGKEIQYEGFDLNKKMIHWCKKNIPNKKNFQFKYLNIYNRYYNSKGKMKVGNFKFPYGNEKFDFIFLISVFTHMFENEMEFYLDEIKRVLKKDGICFLTCFIMNKEKIKNKKYWGAMDFKVNSNKSFTINLSTPEEAVAYDEIYLKSILKKRGFKIKKIIFGAWDKKIKERLQVQDSLIIENGN